MDALVPDTPKIYTDSKEMFQDYETFAFNAVQIIICHMSTFNMAVEMGFGKDLNNPTLSKEEITNIDDQMCCEFHEKSENVKDKRKRVCMISLWTDLMVYDLERRKEGLSADDLANCLDEFMLDNYNTEVDEGSMNQITRMLLNVRREYMGSAHESQTLVSGEYDRLIKFDEEQKAKQPEYKKLYENMKKECDEDCTEACCQGGDDDDEGSGSSSEEDPAPKKTSDRASKK